jgi:hypothetical protein
MTNPKHCGCDACKDGTMHASDCAVHNMPAKPNGSCDCGVLAASEAAPTTIPADVLRALDRMCTPLHESHLKGATAEADAHSMKIIRDYILAASEARDVGVSDAQRDRLLVALERAAIAESALRALADECGNDATPGWEDRMRACIDNANRLLATRASEAAPAPVSDELAAMTRMFGEACAALGLINEALGLHPDDGGAEPILEAIAELKRERDQWVDAQFNAAARGEAAFWQTDDPPIAEGTECEFVAAVRRKHNRKVYVCAATFANKYDDEMINHDGETFIADGWFTCGADMSGEVSSVYAPLLESGDEVLAWQPLPTWGAAAPEAAPVAVGDAKNGVTLTGAQLQAALDFIAPDRDTDREQLEGEVTIQFGTGHSGEGIYCWCAEYPEEGAVLLDAALASQAVPEAPHLLVCSETIRNEILQGNAYAAGLAHGLASLAKSQAAPSAPDAPLKCDFCGALTEDPWHTSSKTERHLHQCDACHTAPDVQPASEPIYQWQGGAGKKWLDCDHAQYEHVGLAMVDPKPGTWGASWDRRMVWSAPQTTTALSDFLADLRRKIAAAPRRQFESAPGVYTNWLDQGAVLDIVDAAKGEQS